MFEEIKEKSRQRREERDRYLNLLITKYKTGDYIKINHSSDIREFHYSAPKDTICVVNEQHIYVSLGRDYKWDRYMYFDNRFHHIDYRLGDGERETHHTFTPNRRAIKAIENKNDMLLTKEERDALDYYKSNRLMNIIAVLFIIGMAIYYLNKM